MASAAAASKKAGAAAPATGTYKVVSPLEHDGELYAVGDEVALTEAQAAPLLGHTVAPPAAAGPAA